MSNIDAQKKISLDVRSEKLPSLTQQSEAELEKKTKNSRIELNENTGKFDLVQVNKEDAYNSSFTQNFGLPDWGIKNFIAERNSWQKGLDSINGEPGFFYFKIFFKFDTNYGLLGGILKEGSINTAIEFLNIRKSNHLADQLASRQIALMKFVGGLSFINEKAPWFFNSITGLQQAAAINFKEMEKEKSIEIGCLEDAVDMRLTTLFDLYKYACFDMINMKEIIPENLRKFDMSILLFHTPIRYWQTGFQSMKDGTFDYKSFNAEQFGNRMSYRMFTFTNCEFDVESLGTFMPNEMNNEKAFTLGKNSFKIKYGRVYNHTLNEWDKIQFGDDGFKHNDDLIDAKDVAKSQKQRQKAMVTAQENVSYYNRSAEIYKAMVDGVESQANDIMRTVKQEDAFGNLYMDNEVRNSFFRNQMKKLRTKGSGSTSIQGLTETFKEGVNALKHLF